MEIYENEISVLEHQTNEKMKKLNTIKWYVKHRSPEICTRNHNDILSKLSKTIVLHDNLNIIILEFVGFGF